MENQSELLYMSHLCDSYAYRALFRLYEPAIGAIARSYSIRFGGCRFSREDLMQEGRMALSQAIETFRGDRGASFHTFAELVIRRRIITCIRSAVRRHDAGGRQLCLDDMVHENTRVYECIAAEHGLQEPEYYFAYSYAGKSLSRLLRTLKPKETAVLREWLSGASYREASERLGVTAKSYDCSLQRLRQKVRKCLCEDDN